MIEGVRADQMLLRDLILEQILDPLSESDRPDKKELQDLKYKLDEITGSVTLNWFLSLFHNVVPWQVSLNPNYFKNMNKS